MDEKVDEEVLDDHAPVQAPPGHPVHTYLQDNRIIAALADQLNQGVAAQDWGAVARILEELSGIDNHYLRKQSQLFPLLERHGIQGPSQVMWGVHDQIRALRRELSQKAQAGDHDGVRQGVPEFARQLSEMIYKEEKILFPMALTALTEGEWAAVRRGEDKLGYVFARPATAPGVT